MWTIAKEREGESNIVSGVIIEGVQGEWSRANTVTLDQVRFVPVIKKILVNVGRLDL